MSGRLYVEQYRLIQTLCGCTGVVGVTDDVEIMDDVVVADVTHVTDIADIIDDVTDITVIGGVTDVTGVTDIMDITGGTVRHMAFWSIAVIGYHHLVNCPIHILAIFFKLTYTMAVKPYMRMHFSIEYSALPQCSKGGLNVPKSRPRQ